MDITYQVDGQERFLSFDAMISATPTHSAQVTEHNVETGSNIADHIVAAQDRLSIEACVTNAPIKVPTTENDSVTGSERLVDLNVGDRYPAQMPRQANVLQFDQQFDRCKDAYEQIRDIVNSKRLVSINADRLPAFNNMVLINLSAPINVDDGDAIVFTFEAVRIRFVDSQLSKEMIFDPVVITRKKRGHQPTKEASAQQKKSFLAAGFDLASE